MIRRSDITVFPDGITPEPGVYVTVKNSAGALVTLYDDVGAVLGNPVLSDANGAFFYNVATPGTYIEEYRLSPTALPRRTAAVGIGIETFVRLTPEMYGAVGRPWAADDGPAFAAMCAVLNAVGRGMIDLLPGRTYPVGSQTYGGSTPFGTYRYAPNTPYTIEINGCTGPVVINGNGARIQCAAGKRYGTFNSDTTPASPTLPFNDTSYAAAPYFYMIFAHNCSGGLHIRDLELDGNISNAIIGGGFGDAGRQIGNAGFLLQNNTGGALIDNVYAHGHGTDGGIGDGPGALSANENVRLVNCSFVNNARQGFSLVGGCGWVFQSCRFNGTGRNLGATMTYSPPGAGFDLEAEGGKWVVRTAFHDCEFSDNIGPGLLADSSTNTRDAEFHNCKFVGTTDWSVWPNRPNLRFYDCWIVGAMANVYADNNDQTETTQFHRCRLSDDVTMSPTGTTFNSGVATFISNGGADGILFNECRWKKTQSGYDTTTGSQGNLATLVGMRLHNCTIENTTTASFIVYGIYSGERTYIKNGNAMPSPEAAALFLFEAGPSLDSFLYENSNPGFGITLARHNASIDRATGKKIFTGSATYDPPSLAAAAKTTIQTMTVTGVALGDKVDEVSFSINLAGARIAAWVSAANTVSFYFINENGANPLDLASGTVRVKVSQA
jgi:hypothetical protein